MKETPLAPETLTNLDDGEQKLRLTPARLCFGFERHAGR